MIIDIAVIAAFLIFGAIGYMRGFIRSVVSMVKVSISVVIAIIFSRPLASILNKAFGLAKTCASLFRTNEKTGGYILIALVAIIIFIVIRLVLRFINKLADKAKENTKVISTLDRWLGFLFGILRFCFIFCILSVVVYILSSIPFLDGVYTWLFKDSTVALWLYDLATDLVLIKALGAFTQAIGLVLNR